MEPIVTKFWSWMITRSFDKTSNKSSTSNSGAPSSAKAECRGDDRPDRKFTWDIVVLDVGMPGKAASMRSKTSSRSARNFGPGASAYEDQLARRMLKAEPRGTSPRTVPRKELVQALKEDPGRRGICERLHGGTTRRQPQ